MVWFDVFDVFLNEEHAFLPFGEFLGGDVAVKFLDGFDDFFEFEG